MWEGGFRAQAGFGCSSECKEVNSVSMGGWLGGCWRPWETRFSLQEKRVTNTGKREPVALDSSWRHQGELMVFRYKISVMACSYI